MEQLTQMELLEIHELLGAEELALKKCQAYLDQLTNDEIRPFIESSINLHQRHLAGLVDLVRTHNGKEGDIR